MDRGRAMEELKLRLENENNIRQSFAVEAIMIKLALHFNEHVNLWGLAGLVHNIDAERIKHNMGTYGMMGGDILEGLEFDNTVVYAVRAHNPANNIPRRRKIDKALFCAAPTAALIIACVMVLPEKKIRDLDESFVLERFHLQGFARNVSRDQIAACSELGFSLEEFIRFSIEAMKEISDELGL